MADSEEYGSTFLEETDSMIENRELENDSHDFDEVS